MLARSDRSAAWLARVVSLIAGGHRNGTHSLLAWLALSVGLTVALGTRHGSAVALIVCVLACGLMLRVITGARATRPAPCARVPRGKVGAHPRPAD